MKLFSALAFLLMFATISASAAPIAEEPQDPFEAQDPWKSFNQVIFDFNLAADRYVIKPIAQAYHLVPDTGRTAVTNFISNLGEPLKAVNGVLQLDPTTTLTAFWRFTLNSTFGLAGLEDFAGVTGLKNKENGFSKTLTKYGVEQGPYVVLPIVGPSTARDTTGTVVDWFSDPVGFFMTLPEDVAESAVDGLSTRDNDAAVVDQFYYNSLEPYSATRAAYLQHQAFHH